MEDLFSLNYSKFNIHLAELGFCSFKLLDENQIELLLNAYKENTPNSLNGFHPTMFYDDSEYRKIINDIILDVFTPIVEAITKGCYKILYGNFMVKESDEFSNMKIHQDWTYVDERKYNSFAIWVPLCDLNTENGAFHAVPYSHKADNLFRGPGTFCPFYEHRELIEQKFNKPLYLKAGEAVCWNHRLAHYSPANKSSEPRIAVTVIVVPKEVEVYHYIKPDFSNQIFKFSIGERFFETYKINSFPPQEAKSIDNYFPVNYSKNQIIEMLTPHSIKRIFMDEKLSSQFSNEGFVVLDLLNNDEFLDLENLYRRLFNEYKQVESTVNSDYDLSFFRQNGEIKKRIFDEMWAFFEPKIKIYLPNYEPLIINMFNKLPGTGEVPIHQNWTFVDEDYHTSVSVWIPLCDVTRENGTLEIIPGSHLNISKYRGPTIPWAFQGMENLLKEKYMQPLELKKGQVSILDDAIIHYSADNHSDKERPTIQLILKPKDAVAIHYHTDSSQNGKLNKYKVDASFFMDFDMNSKTIDAPLIDTFSFQLPIMKESDLQSNN